MVVCFRFKDSHHASPHLNKKQYAHSRLDQRDGVTVERLGFLPYPREQTAAALRTVAVRFGAL